MSGPAPSRKAASSARMASSTCRSAFSSGKPALRPKPGTWARGVSPRSSTLVLSAVYPLATTSRPTATMSARVRTGGICISLARLTR